jgi:hypothetical protein
MAPEEMKLFFIPTNFLAQSQRLSLQKTNNITDHTLFYFILKQPYKVRIFIISIL